MYYITFSVIFGGGLLEVLQGKKTPYLFNLAFLLMSFMAAFRYDQLADYSNYKLIYYTPEAAGITDPLFFSITEAFNWLGISYEIYVIIFAVVTMILSYPFFARICKKSLLALCIFYSYIFLILPMSAMRQGLCLAMVLYGFTLLLEGRKKKFYLLIIIGMFIHFSIIACLLIVYFFDKKLFNNWYICWVIIGATCFALTTPDISSYIPDYFLRKSLGERDGSRLLQILIRFLLIIPCCIVRPRQGSYAYYAKAICIVGYVLYCLFSFFPTASARLEFYFRVFLCLFVSCMSFPVRRNYIRNLVLLSIFSIHIFLFFKNMDAAIDQGEYNRQKVSIFTFPYVSIFDKEEIVQYK